MKTLRRTLASSFISAFALMAAALHAAELPLHEQIDSLFAEAELATVASVCNDYEFLRRVYLDLIGRTPSVAELNAFIAKQDSNKRDHVITQLLDSSEFDDYFAGVLDVMFMERRSGTRIPQQEWRAFLKQALVERWPYDKLVRTIVASDGTGPFRAAAKFSLQRAVEPNALTRDIGRIFLGRDLQCAQCHDHPNISDYEQSEYYGILAFVQRSYLFEDSSDNNKAYVGEKAEGESEYKSVFFPDDDATTPIPQLLNGLQLELEPPSLAATAYVVAPTKTSRGVPHFSRRRQLARLITHPENGHFSKNAVNRFWAHMLGKGLVNPVDFRHGDNPPTHPVVLESLAEGFVSSNFDLRSLLKEIALTSVYQRTVDLTEGVLLDADTKDQLSYIDERVEQLQSEIRDLDDDQDQAVYEARLRLHRKSLKAVDRELQGITQELSKQTEAQEKKSDELGKLQKQLQQETSRNKVLTNASNAAKKAANAFAKDQKLADAAKEFANRVAASKKKMDSAKSALDKQQKEQAALKNAIAQLKQEHAQLVADRTGISDMVAEARGAIGVLQMRQRRFDIAQVENRQRLKQLETLKEFVSLKGQLLAKRQALATMETKTQQDNTGKQRRLLEQVSNEIRMFQATVQSRERREVTAVANLDAQKQAMVVLKSTAEELRQVARSLDAKEQAKADELDRQARGLLEEIRQAQIAVDARVAETRKSRDKLKQLIAKKQDLKVTLLRRRASLMEQHQQSVDELEVKLRVARQRLQSRQARRFEAKPLSPLSPEQLAGSTISALELEGRFQREAASEWANKNKPKDGEEAGQVDAEKKEQEIAALFKKRVDQVVNTYVSLFAAPGGAPQDVFSATADQALFLANDGRVQSWLRPSNGTLLKRLQSVEDNKLLANEMHLALLSRPATAEERSEIDNYLTTRKSDRNKAINEVAWGLLSSLEFRFNH